LRVPSKTQYYEGIKGVKQPHIFNQRQLD